MNLIQQNMIRLAELSNQHNSYMIDGGRDPYNAIGGGL